MTTWLVLLITVLSSQDPDHGVFCHKGLVAAHDGHEAQELLLNEVTEDQLARRQFTIYGAVSLHSVDLTTPVVLVSGEGEGERYCSFREDPDGRPNP